MTSYRKNRIRFLSSTLLFLCISCGAQAQMIDYTSFEALFGEPVTTSATGQPQKSSEAPVTMEIVTADDIRRSGATNIPEVLRYVSGVSVWQWGRAQHDVSVRGYNRAFSNRLLVLINGRQVYLDHYGVTQWDNLPIQMEEIRQIEVVKGPNAALFGFNATGGVINIITYNPLYDKVGSAGVRYGSNNYKQGHLLQTFKPNDKLGIRLSGGGVVMDQSTERPGDGTYYDAKHNSLSVDGVSQITPDSQLRIEASRNFIETDEWLNDYNNYPNNGYVYSTRASYSKKVNEGIIEASLYRNWFNARTITSSVLIKNSVTVGQIGYLFPISNNHKIRIQGEYRYNDMGGTTVVSPGSHISYDVYSASGMWNWSITDKLAWTNALRLDYLKMKRTGDLTTNAVLSGNENFNGSLSQYSYNSGLVWKVNGLDTIRLSTARGVQVPSLFDFGIDLNAGPIQLMGNPNLNPSIVTNYENWHWIMI